MSTLAQDLRQFYGSEQLFRHPLNPKMLYTEGVKYLAENGGTNGCYWLLDIIATEAMEHHKKHDFLVINLYVSKDETAELTISDGDGNTLTSRTLDYTDMQPGVWELFLMNNTVLLPTEY